MQVFRHIFKIQGDYKPIAVIKHKSVCQGKVLGNPFLKRSTDCSLQNVSTKFPSRDLPRTNDLQQSHVLPVCLPSLTLILLTWRIG